MATTTTGIVYAQILVGAAMRHTEAGLAIPDFPLMFGGLIPDRWSAAIAVHFAHRVGALIVTSAIGATCWHVWRHHRSNSGLTRPSFVLPALVIVQITLGGLTVLSRRDVWINSTHLVCGALILATSLVLTLRSWRTHFALGATLGSSDADDSVSASAMGLPRKSMGARA